ARISARTPNENGGRACAGPGKTKCRRCTRKWRGDACFVRHGINFVCHLRTGPHTRFCLTGGARDWPPTLFAVRARAVVHDRTRRETQVAAGRGSECSFRRGEKKSGGSSAIVLLRSQSVRGGNDRRRCGHARCISSDPGGAATASAD